MRTTTRTAVLAATLALVAGVAPVGTAAGQGTPLGSWEAPLTTLVPYTLGTWDGGTSVDGAGNTVGFWTSQPDESVDEQSVFAATRPRDGAWTPAVRVWEGDYATYPRLAGNPAGDLVGTWIGHHEGSPSGVHVIERSGATGAWGGHQDFSGELLGQTEPQVAVTAGGDAFVAWTEVDSTDPDGVGHVRAARRTAGGWTAPITISDSDGFSAQPWHPIQISANADGTARVVWIASADDASGHIREARFDGSSWTAPRAIHSTTGWFDRLEMAGDGQGNDLVVWLTNDPALVQVASFRGDDWTVSDLSGDPGNSCTATAAVSTSGGGHGTIAWVPDATRSVTAVTGTVGAWSAPATLSDVPEDGGIGEIALGETAGRLPTALWTTNGDDQYYTVAGSRLTGAGWEPERQLMSAGGRGFSRPTISINGAGDTAAMWTSYWGYAGKLFATGFRGSAPTEDAAEPEVVAPGLNPPFIRVRGGRLKLPRRGNTVTARLMNRERVALTGTARLIHFYGRQKSPAMRRIAAQKTVRIRSSGRSLLRLKLNPEAMRRLRKARRHSFPARLYLDVASADGRKVRTTTTFTLDGQKRFGTAPRAAKAAC